MYRRLLSLWAAVVLLLVGILPANASAYGRGQITDNTETVYRASTGIFTTATSATDIFNFKGSSTKTIYIRKITWKQSNLSASQIHWVYLVKRSTANSGGTSSALTAVPLDSNFSSATASGVYYTANPSSLGTSLGTVVSLPAVMLSSYSHQPWTDIFDASKGGSPIVLRGTGESVSLNYNATTDAIDRGAIVDIEWSEK